MRDALKHLHAETALGHLLIGPFKRLYDMYRYRLLPEDTFLRKQYKQVFGRDLSLDNPKSLNEKVQWLKLHVRTPLLTQCADKYAVREYIANAIGAQYLIPLVLHTRKPSEIRPERLPDYPFIIKATHGSGGVTIVRDKSDVNWKALRHSLNLRLKRNIYYETKEWPYKNIEPRIVVEKFLMDSDGNQPMDYKLHCFNGQLAFIQVDLDRFANHRRNFYDPEWQLMDFQVRQPRHPDGVQEPPQFQIMRSLAETLSKEFIYVRVDFYNLDDKLFFGELTFYPGSGLSPFIPPEWDERFGNMLKLPTDS